MAFCQPGASVTISAGCINYAKLLSKRQKFWKVVVQECGHKPCTYIESQGLQDVIEAPSGQQFTLDPSVITDYVKKKVSVGDTVRIISCKDTIKKYQHNHGGWSELMSMFIGQDVLVVDVKEDGDCFVTKYGMEFMFNQRCFANWERDNDTASFLCHLKEGDLVKVTTDIRTFKEYYLGKWNPKSRQYLGKTVKVDSVLEDGRVSVSISGDSLILDKRILTRIVRPGDVTRFVIGDRVKVIREEVRVRQLQIGHGGWRDSMSDILGKEGRVKRVFRDHDLDIKIREKRWTLNPLCVKMAQVESDSDSDSLDSVGIVRQSSQMYGGRNSDSRGGRGDDVCNGNVDVVDVETPEVVASVMFAEMDGGDDGLVLAVEEFNVAIPELPGAFWIMEEFLNPFMTYQY